MKKILKLLILSAAFTIFLTCTAFGGELFSLPSAGAETVLRNIPIDYSYSPEWKTIKTSVTEDTSAPAVAAAPTAESTGDNAAPGAADEGEGAVQEETAAPSESASNPQSTDEGNTTADAAQESRSTPAVNTPVAVSNKVICIDAGHQSKGNNSPEPIGPGASETKAKVAGGTRGVVTGVPEYQLTLDVALKLQSELTARGYTVVMCRTSNDVNISNAERAEIANKAGAGAFLRLHGNGAGSADASGAETLAPSASNPYCGAIASQSQALSKAVLNGLCAESGAKNRGVKIADNMSGINWSRVPVTIVEMGYMTNPAEDQAMQDPSYQSKLAKGMADGVDAYFGL